MWGGGWGVGGGGDAYWYDPVRLTGFRKSERILGDFWQRLKTTDLNLQLIQDIPT